MLSSKWILGKLALSLVFLTMAGTVAMADEGPFDGWALYGTDPQGYIIGTEDLDRGTVAYIKSDKPEKNKFGTISQTFASDDYKGQRIRFSADVKSIKVKGWAGMWLRIDFNGKAVAFDNMKSRPIKGTSDWHNLSIVLDVPQDSDLIAMGLLMSGDGKVLWDNLKIEEVGTDVPVTDLYKNRNQKRPTNLNFESVK